MKATINASGIMIINAETHIEAYAIKKWYEENSNRDGKIKSDKIIISWKDPENELPCQLQLNN